MHKPHSSAPSPARLVAFRTLLGVGQGASLNAVLHQELGRRKLSEEDRRLATDLAFGTTRNRLRLDGLLARFSSKPLETLDIEVCIALRLGLYQLLYLERVPAFAVVDEAVRLVSLTHRKASGFVNGVLRSAGRALEDLRSELPPPRSCEGLAAWLSYPGWLVERWKKRFGEEATCALMEFSSGQAPLCGWWNASSEGIPSLQESETQWGGLREGQYVPHAFYPGAAMGPPFENTLYQKGLIHFQSEGSQAVAECLGVSPGMAVLDLCAAPGGKTALAAKALGRTGRLVAADVSETRLQVAKKTLERLHLGPVEWRVLDGLKLPDEFSQTFDRVLVDAPCSSTGVLRRHPDVKWRLQPEMLPELAAMQEALLESAAKAVKAGGVLLYSVCSLEEEETSWVAKAFTEAHPEFLPVRLDELVPSSMLPLIEKEGRLWIFPPRTALDGFFAVAWKRE